MRDGRAMFIKGHARSFGFSARSCAFLLVTVLSPWPSEVRAEVATKVTARGGVVADEPKEFSWVMAVGSERTLPKGSWTVDEGTSIVELGPASKPAKLAARQVGTATLHTSGSVVHVTVAAGRFEVVAGLAAQRVFFAGRNRDGTFADASSPLRAVLQVPRDRAVHGPLRVVSYDAAGAFVTEKFFPVEALVPCAEAAGVRCLFSPLLHLVPESIEEQDAGSGELAVEARLGGRVTFAMGTEELASLPVCVEDGATCGYVVVLKPLLVRAWPGGPTVFHGATGGEREAFRERIERVLRPWETCGIRASFEPVRVVDPPADVLVSFGLPFGLLSDGREVLEVHRGKVTTTIAVPRALAPIDAAKFVQSALRPVGIASTLIARPWLAHEEAPSAELAFPAATSGALRVTVREPGRLALEAVHVELRDGLEHFDDARATSGSQEERALLLPLLDGDSRTVDVVAVPFFSDGRRVGESFVALDDPSLVNVILVDRAGLAASRTSHVVAHELGHVLLRTGDHPDEGSRDTPRLLMDSDATDASRFGPRLITVDECARARVQGSSMPYRLLTTFSR